MRKKQVSIIRWLDTGIFPATIMLSAGFTYDEMMKHLKKMKADGWAHAISEDKVLIDAGNYFGLSRIREHTKTGKREHYFYIIITEDFRFTDYEMCKLAHEVLHVVQFILKDILDIEREYEALAYTHTHVMQQCLKHLRK